MQVRRIWPGILTKGARELKVNLQNLRLILPEGDLLAPICRENPVATVASVADVSRQKA